MTLSERIHRANAAVECEKVMSLHVYYHAAGIHREEIENYWTKSGECTWAHVFGQMGDKENFILNYAAGQEKDTRDVFEQVAEVYPEVLDKHWVPDYRAICEEAMHFTVSPLIEVAEDGQTAKGLWYTPGCIFSTLNPQQAREGTWIWERYGADFVYEDGRWLYKNLKVCCDINGAMDEENWPLLDRPMGPPPSGDGEEDGGPPPGPGGGMNITHPGPLYFDNTPTQLPQETPFIPVPYKTFTETYNYATLTGIYEKK